MRQHEPAPVNTAGAFVYLLARTSKTRTVYVRSAGDRQHRQGDSPLPDGDTMSETPTENTTATDAVEADAAPQETTEQEAPKTFTQEELDAIIGKRLAAHDKKYADYDSLKAAASKLAEIEKANLSEVERAQAEAKEWQAKYEEAVNASKKAEISAAIAAANSTTLSTDYLIRILDVSDPSEAADAVAQFLADNPSLKKGPQVPASPGASKAGKAEIDPTASIDDFKAYVKATFG